MLLNSALNREIWDHRYMPTLECHFSKILSVLEKKYNITFNQSKMNRIEIIVKPDITLCLNFQD